MNNKNIQKLSVFLTGLMQRVADNKDYFKKITAAYKSGTKDYYAIIVLESAKMKLSFNGIIEILEINCIATKLSKFAEAYDAVLVTYEERGTTIVIEADNKNVKMKTKEAAIESADKPQNIEKSQSVASHLGNREYFVKVGQADELLKEIGILGSNGKIKNNMIRKYNQIDHFVELVRDILVEVSEKQQAITVLDCGCGKSYLTFVLNYYIKEVLKKPCYFIGLDYSNNVIEESKRMADSLGYKNMEFKVTDIRDYCANRSIDLVISLHACDTATDEAIALAVNNNVQAMVMVPCCHKELLSQYSFRPFDQILKQGILKARMADIMTDGMRALLLESLGYKISMVEYISPLETPKNLMIRAEKVNSPNTRALEEYQQIKKMLDVQPTLERLINK